MHTPSPRGSPSRQNSAEVSRSSSRSSTRIIPYCLKKASCTASDPVRWPVCASAIRRPDPELHALRDGPALVPGLRDQRELFARRVGEALERVEVGVRSEQPDAALASDPGQLLLAAAAFLAELAEAGREDDAEPGGF